MRVIREARDPEPAPARREGSPHAPHRRQAHGAGRDPHRTIRDVREKYLDDLKRNRELAALGCVVLPVTARDLFGPGGLDAVMLEAAMAIDELDGGPTLQNMRAVLDSPRERKRRQQLLWSLLPWPEGARHAREARAWRPWQTSA